MKRLISLVAVLCFGCNKPYVERPIYYGQQGVYIKNNRDCSAVIVIVDPSEIKTYPTNFPINIKKDDSVFIPVDLLKAGLFIACQEDGDIKVNKHDKI